MKKITVAVAGNPNVGKTTILNAIAGTALKVGNWPGVTVEKKEATVRYKDYEIHFVDLPGIYTLEPISEDEKIAVEFLEKGNVDVILTVLDSTNLERSLYLTVQLFEFEKPTVLVLNLYDEAQKLGIEIDEKAFYELLGVKAVKTVGKKGTGVEKILPLIVEAYEEKHVPRLKYSEELEEFLSEVAQKYKSLKAQPFTKHELIEFALRDKELQKKFKEKYGKEFKKYLEDERYAFAHGIYEEVVKQKGIDVRTLTDFLDNLLLHPVLGFVFFVVIMFLLFKVTFDFSSPFVDWVDGFFTDFLNPAVKEFLASLGAPEFISRFFSEAVIGGVGFVLTFVPLIFTLYFLITFLEMSGYVPRVAFLMDKFLHRMGLHGKSVIPLILALGCNVPAIVATRTLETTREKLIVIAMIPFISCPARLVVFSFFAITFFPNNAALVITGLYLLGVAVALLTAFLMRKSIARGASSHFVIELPPYRMPSLKTVLNISWIHVKDFLYRAGTLIFAASIFIWILLNLPPNVKNPKDSLAADIGRVLVPVFEPMGISDWRATTSLIPAFLAREIVLSSMGVIYTATEVVQEKEKFSFSEELKNQLSGLLEATKTAVKSVFSLKIQALEVEEEETGQLRDLIRNSFTPASAFAFMVFILIYTSCLGTYATMGREIGYGKATAFLVYSFVLAWIIGTISYKLLS
ncbi:ferrous iron transport protein B [Aquifex aeolicus]|uniref:Ferrous iron transport protein B n=1 Tax=Aquifex aeolicus (strain VF5) TaxID=224324 RepID=O67296_AQUAE|nr:ferrous iron transport protein B [Aquifex aeolicus]AAC07257.1 ferrous iron transport protein B [Aquifex aeolicus VF5]